MGLKEKCVKWLGCRILIHISVPLFLKFLTETLKFLLWYSISLFMQARFHTLNGFRQSSGKDMVGCFSLSEVWKFYVEKSFYGSAVPILLNDGDTVVQYYAPSLSAIQIYTTKPSASFRCCLIKVFIFVFLHFNITSTYWQMGSSIY